jgi:hypothetical protein
VIRSRLNLSCPADIFSFLLGDLCNSAPHMTLVHFYKLRLPQPALTPPPLPRSSPTQKCGCVRLLKELSWVWIISLFSFLWGPSKELSTCCLIKNTTKIPIQYTVYKCNVQGYLEVII